MRASVCVCVERGGGGGGGGGGGALVHAYSYKYVGTSCPAYIHDRTVHVSILVQVLSIYIHFDKGALHAYPY